uniref:Uncharacterized protein n=1 Tax=Anopheles dirus TaxID=7168 RepID=A0A182N558_9DIPT
MPNNSTSTHGKCFSDVDDEDFDWRWYLSGIPRPLLLLPDGATPLAAPLLPPITTPSAPGGCSNDGCPSVGATEFPTAAGGPPPPAIGLVAVGCPNSSGGLDVGLGVRGSPTSDSGGLSTGSAGDDFMIGTMNVRLWSLWLMPLSGEVVQLAEDGGTSTSFERRVLSSSVDANATSRSNPELTRSCQLDSSSPTTSSARVVKPPPFGRITSLPAAEVVLVASPTPSPPFDRLPEAAFDFIAVRILYTTGSTVVALPRADGMPPTPRSIGTSAVFIVTVPDEWPLLPPPVGRCHEHATTTDTGGESDAARAACNVKYVRIGTVWSGGR